MFSSARQAEIIRSNQKDEFYTSFIKSSVTDIIQRLFGPRVWLNWRKELDLAADLGYFGLTTLAGFQTLGEEYVNIIEVDDSRRTLPSKLHRGLMIALQVAAPYVIDRILKKVEKHCRLEPESSLTPEAKRSILAAIPVIRHTVTLLHRCHLALFYMHGAFYHIAKRFTSIHYILVRDPGDGARSNYRILGWLAIIQLAFTFLRHLHKWVKTKSNSNEINLGPKTETTVGQPIGQLLKEEDGSRDPALKCVLCLETRTNSTATPCGHLFCWTCITEWCSKKPECPLCREQFQMSRLVCLQNYDPS